MAAEEFASCVMEKTGLNIVGDLTGLSSDQLKAVIDWWGGLSSMWQAVLAAGTGLLVAAIVALAPEVAGAISTAIDGAELKAVLNAMVQCADQL
ncbi:MAG TPA: hypothetical protein VGS97_10975 [Actinocrinis sp.]|uniref:hypothetical protein n=1 Tax=Actinocrinis sp. TaxID=1920516 RepID=UPI002DDD0106|nr:hypothetical protein [Actinocrinis sp.]HEV2344606.1 hypothetical protein [Actinocrinis sp.]